MECEIIEKLNNATNNIYGFSLKSAILDKVADFCVFEIYYKDGIILTPEKKSEIKSIMTNIIPQIFSFEVKFVKNYLSEERAVEELETFIKNNFPSVAFSIKSVKFEDGKFIFNIIIDELAIEHAKSKNLCVLAEKYFKENFDGYEFLFETEEGKVFSEDEKNSVKENYKEEDVDIFAKRKIEVTDKEVYIGEEISEPASYIKDKQSLKMAETVVFCGTLKHFRANVIKPKKKDKEETSSDIKDNSKPQNKEDTANINVEAEQENFYQKKYYKWTLSDFTGEIPCQYFSVKATQAKMDTINENSSVIVSGKLELNKYSEELNLIVHDLSFCKLPEKFEEYIEYRKEKPFYEFVKPEKMVTYKQSDLLAFMQEEEVCPYLQNKTFVCYDLETTGLHFEGGDRIIEIGAVKIEDGKITEKFESLVNPERNISEGASKVNHIYDSDVKDAPTASQALQDFYKFTRGAILIGYNSINFDNVFLIGQGKLERWNFDNACEDIYRLAQKYVFGVKNYKLITIAEKLGVKLDNAHRAFYDTLATAEVFIKLAANIKS